MKRPPNFNRLARSYRQMEQLTFGQWLWRCRCAFLGELGSCRSALVLGDGDGRFSARLLEENPTVIVDALDASPLMLLELVRNAGLRASRVRVHQADARYWEPQNPRYDLVVSHFFLDCLTTKEVKSLVARLRPCVKPGALWVVSEFSTPPGWYGWLVARPLVTALYLIFGLLTGLTVFRLPKYHEALEQAGFVSVERRHWLRGLLVSELWVIPPAGAGQRTTPPQA